MRTQLTGFHFPRSPLRRMLTAGAGVALALAAVSASWADTILPFKELQVGMKGEGRSVFEGIRISRFDAEIIGLMENIGPKRNLILVRLSGDPVDRTGVMEGMSGSPIYVNGRVIGALAYSWPFSKETIGGVTPIEEMLDMQKRGGGAPGRSRLVPPLPGVSPFSALFRPDAILAHFDGYLSLRGRIGTEGSSLTPLRLPVALAGFPAPLVERMTPDLVGAGLVPVQAGVSGRSPELGDTLQPGSAVAAKLVKGDVEIAGIGTVTYRDGDRILALGHPLLNMGPMAVPMAPAVVHTLLPSLHSSFKIASAAPNEIGSFDQDRVVGISGKTGASSTLLPVRLEMRGTDGGEQRFAFDVVEDSFLTPYLIYASLNAILSTTQKDYGEATIRLREGSVMKVSGEQDINLSNFFSGDLAPFYASGTVAYISQLILNNESRPSRITGINLFLSYADERRTARVTRVWCEKDRVKPGESVALTVTLRPFRGEEITRTFYLTIPEELTPGKLTLQVGDGQTVSRKEEEGTQEFYPRDLSQLIWLINHIRTNDRIYVILTRPDNGILFQGTRMPDLPPSKSLVMLRPQTEGNFLRVAHRGIAEESIPTDYFIDGYKQLTLEVEE